jgi:hypothetical protein
MGNQKRHDGIDEIVERLFVINPLARRITFKRKNGMPQ